MRKKGGSVASNAVSGLVTDGAYNALTKNFSNFTNSGKCGGRKHIRGGNSTGNVFTTVSNAFVNGLGLGGTKEGFNVFRSNPAPANASYADLRGNVTAKSGGKVQARNISHYMNNASDYNVRHKRGGADSMNGLDYSIIPSVSKLVGNSTASRVISDDVLQLKASDNVAASPALVKDAHYGSVKDGFQLFNYAGTDKIVGGKKKTTKKTSKKTPVKKAKKPVAKKVTKKPKTKKC